MSTTAIRWPDRTQLQRLMHAPGQCVADASLHGLTVQQRMGRILSWNGQRTIVFRGTAGGRDIALRCPLAPDAAAEARYVALREHTAQLELPSFVDADWIANGIEFEPGQWIPIMTMEWVDGRTIEDHVTEVVDDGEHHRLGALADEWWRCCAEVRRSDLAHGDIHAGNVMVRPGTDGDELVLIDYDSVWVPGLEHRSHEIGLPAFQHPQRDVDHWGPDMDAFANLVMYLSLRAIAHDPRLWDAHHHNDDTMIFDTESLRTAPGAPVWADLTGSDDPQIVHLAELLVRWLRQSPIEFDSLESAASSSPASPSTTPPPPPPSSSSTPTTAPTQSWPSPAADDRTVDSGETDAPPSRGTQSWGSPPAPPAPPSQPPASPSKQSWPPSAADQTDEGSSDDTGSPTPFPPRPAPTNQPSDVQKWVGWALVVAVVVILIIAAL